jgi:hypothetical protein
MQDIKKPHTTFLNHLTQDNYFLNEKCNELYKLNETLQRNVQYLNNFVFSTYDISGNYVSNLKIIAYDSSNNIISYICSDSSGNFSTQNKIDLSKNKLNTHLKNTILNTETHINDSSRCFPFYGYYGGYGFPYYPPYGYPYRYGYPYLYRDGLTDDDNRDISLNNIQHFPPIPHPVSMMHRDMIDHSLIHKEYDLHYKQPESMYSTNPIYPIHYYNK